MGFLLLQVLGMIDSRSGSSRPKSNGGSHSSEFPAILDDRLQDGRGVLLGLVAVYK